MLLIYIADVGRELLEALLVRNKHEIIIFSTKVRNSSQGKMIKAHTFRTLPK